MTAREDLAYGPEPWQLLDLCLPEGAPPKGTFLWFHGGGLEAGSRKDIPFAADLVAAGYAVASADYRLYPGAVFPGFVEDAAAAAAFLRAEAARLGAPPPLYVGGQSAGAYLALLLALDRSYLARRGLAPEDFAGFVADSAQTTVHYRVLSARGLDPRLVRVDEAAPLHHLGPGPSPPPLLAIYYADDVPGRPEQNRLFARTLRHLSPEADFTLAELPGGHTSGSTTRGPGGDFPFVTAFLAWTKRGKAPPM